MSKQDRTYIRTASDLERKYNFGQSFAEVFGLVSDARDAAEEAQKAVDELDATLTHEEIFNRLTDYGKVQGIYRGDDGDVYINASYIKSGTISAERLNLTGAITWGDLDYNTQSIINSAGGISESYAQTIITRTLVSSPVIKGAKLVGNELELYASENANSPQFYIGYYLRDGTDPTVYISSPDNATIELQSSLLGGTVTVEALTTFSAGTIMANGTNTWFSNCPVHFSGGTVDFTGATVTGLSVVFG